MFGLRQLYQLKFTNPMRLSYIGLSIGCGAVACPRFRGVGFVRIGDKSGNEQESQFATTRGNRCAPQ